MSKKPGLIELFLSYCRDFAAGVPREKPLSDRTLARYHRGLKLVQKIVGHDLETVSDTDQTVFMDGIMKYHQGTRRVSTQIFQRYIAWGIKNGYLNCRNILRGKENDIIGPNTPPKYTYLTRTDIASFLKDVKDPQLRCALGLVYYGGLTATELAFIKTEQVADTGIMVYRERLKKSQILPLPDRFVKELYEYAQTRNKERLFDIGSSDIAVRVVMRKWYISATVQSRKLIGTVFNDFRLSGIRHFYEECQSIEMTKDFAGAPRSKKGWLESLVDISSYQMKKITDARSYYASSK